MTMKSHFWNGAGNSVDGAKTAAEAIVAAGLDWKVETAPVFHSLSDGEYSTVPGSRVIRRTDTGAPLGVTGTRYEPINNVDAFNIADGLVEKGAARFIAAGGLHGGKKVWMLAKYDGDIEIAGKTHEKLLLLLTGHDGVTALSVQWILNRLVCSNQLTAAVRGAMRRHGKLNRAVIRHTANWKDGEAEVRRILGLTDEYFAKAAEELTRLNDKLLSPEEMAEFAKLLAPSKEGEEVPTRTANIRADIERLFWDGKGNDGKTRLDAYNAVVDYVDHNRAVRGDGGRFESALMTSGAALKQKAYDFLNADELVAGLMAKDVTLSDHTSDFARLMKG